MRYFFKNLIIFLLYGVLGWVIDTGYRSLEAQAYTPGTWIPFFSLIYPVGAFLVLSINDELPVAGKPLWLRIVVFAFFCTIVEYIGGLLGIQFLGERLWDYDRYELNIHRLIEPWHTVAWGLLSVFVVDYLHPRLTKTYDRIVQT